MTVQYVFGNFFETELTVGITAAGTTILVPPSMALALPVCDPAVPSQAQLVLWDGNLPPEIVTCTTNTQNGQLTVVRAQEGTTPQAWSAGTQIRSALTAQIINSALAAYFNIQQVLASAFLPLTGGTLSGPLLLNADPAAALGAATKQYVDNVQGNKLPLTGGTMQGSINMNNNRIVTLPAPVSGTEAARLTEVNAEATIRGNYNLDASGVLNTAGTATAYTVTPNQTITALSDGLVIAVRPHTVNGAHPNITVGTAPAADIQATPGVNLPAAFLRAGVPYRLMYSQAFTAWIIVGAVATSTAYTVGDEKWSRQTADHDFWLLQDGRNISRTTHAPLFALLGTTYGVGDGSTTFGIPDMRGRSHIAADNMNGSAANRAQVTTNLTTTNTSTTATVASATGLCEGMNIVGNANVPANTVINTISGTTITMSHAATGSATVSTRFSTLADAQVVGSTGGELVHTTGVDEMPAHNHTGTAADHSHTLTGTTGTESNARGPGPGSSLQATGGATSTGNSGALALTVANAGGGLPHNNLHPVMVSNSFIYSPH